MYRVPDISQGDAGSHDFDCALHGVMSDIGDAQSAVPAPLNYRGFPKSICTSVNHVVCHGIPGPRKLKSGDIVNIDVTVIKDGFHGDTSRMFFVGKPTVLAKRVSDIAHDAMQRAIEIVRPGVTLGDIGHTIQNYVESKNCSIVEEYCGHGIGRIFHEDPQVLHYGTAGTGMPIEEGMTFTIEPMVNAGKRHVKLLPGRVAAWGTWRLNPIGVKHD